MELQKASSLPVVKNAEAVRKVEASTEHDVQHEIKHEAGESPPQPPHDRTRQQPVRPGSSYSNLTLGGRAVSWIQTATQINGLTVNGNATVYINHVENLNNIEINGSGAAFFGTDKTCIVHVGGRAHTWYGGEFDDLTLSNKGVVIYRESPKSTHSNKERACLQCRIADENCSQTPISPRSWQPCERCKRLDRFCAESEAWSDRFSVARDWLKSRPEYAPRIAIMDIPCEPSARPQRPGLRLAGTGHGFAAERHSRSNRFKLMVERWIKSQILWWPFQPPLRYEDAANVEIWSCECGALVAREFSHRSSIKDDKVTAPEQLSDKKGSELKRTSERTGNVRDQQESDSGEAPSANTMKASSGRTASQLSAKNLQQSSTSGASSHVNQPMSPNPHLRDLEGRPAKTQGYFHACFAKRRQTPKLFEISAQDIHEADFLAKFINTFHRTLWFRNLWTMSECGGVHFVQFKRLSENNDYVDVINFGLPSPDDTQYEFTRGKDSKWLADKISHALTEHTLTNLFASMPLVGPWLVSFRTCRESFIHLVPRKVSDGVSSIGATTEYGMLAYSRVALWRVVLTSLFYLGVGFAYVVWRWTKDWNGMQMALAPIVLLFALWLGHLHLAVAVVDRYNFEPPGV